MQSAWPSDASELGERMVRNNLDDSFLRGYFGRFSIETDNALIE
jgi:hypothetical protein